MSSFFLVFIIHPKLHLVYKNIEGEQEIKLLFKELPEAVIPDFHDMEIEADAPARCRQADLHDSRCAFCAPEEQHGRIRDGDVKCVPPDLPGIDRLLGRILEHPDNHAVIGP